MADYYAFPLWAGGERGGMLSPDALPHGDAARGSRSLVGRLHPDASRQRLCLAQRTGPNRSEYARSRAGRPRRGRTRVFVRGGISRVLMRDSRLVKDADDLVAFRSHLRGGARAKAFDHPARSAAPRRVDRCAMPGLRPSDLGPTTDTNQRPYEGWTCGEVGGSHCIDGGTPGGGSDEPTRRKAGTVSRPLISHPPCLRARTQGGTTTTTTATRAFLEGRSLVAQ